jgi:hypothetical protein
MTGKFRLFPRSRSKPPNAMKNASPQKSPVISIIDALDQAMDCCENISAIALLLQDSGGHAALDEYESTVLSGAGRLIAHEARKLKTLIDNLEEQFAQPKKHSPKKSAQ